MLIYDNQSKLYLQNNIEYLNSIEDNTIDLTVTSPPYDSLRDYTGEECWTFENFKLLARELYRTTKTGGVVVWNVADQTVNGSETGSSFKQALFFIDCGFKLADTMIYKKANPGGARGSNKTYIQCFEYMFVLSKSCIKTHNLIYDRKNKREPGVHKTGGRRNKDGTLEHTKNIDIKEYGRRFNVWEYSTAGDDFSKKHPAPFPYQLAEDHILTWTNEGDIVFDPFSGSGTTILAAAKNKRIGIGVDISEEYSYLAKDRLELHLGDENINFS